MKHEITRDEWLAEKVAKARASVAAGRTLSHDEAKRVVAKFVAEHDARARGKAA